MKNVTKAIITIILTTLVAFIVVTKVNDAKATDMLKTRVMQAYENENVLHGVSTTTASSEINAGKATPVLTYVNNGSNYEVYAHGEDKVITLIDGKVAIATNGISIDAWMVYYGDINVSNSILNY